MRLLLFFFLFSLSFGAVAYSEPPQKGFWKVLVTPGAKWTLVDSVDAKAKKARILVESYDVRTVAGADVARLRWTRIWGPGKTEREDYGDSDQGRYTQVAVTAAGLYILSADMDDAKVAEALKRKPSRSDPPKAYKGSKQNSGRYLLIESDDSICVGYEPLPDAGECPDTCFGEICFSAKQGPIKLSGTWAPDNGVYAGTLSPSPTSGHH